MKLTTILAELRLERERLDKAIAALESLDWPAKTGSVRQPPRRRRHMSAAARRRISDMMKKRWAERKKKTKKAA